MMIVRRDQTREETAHMAKVNKWLPVFVIATAVAIWGLLLAVGAYLDLGDEQPERDARKFWIVLASVGAYLAFWGIALLVRARRQSRQPPEASS